MSPILLWLGVGVLGGLGAVARFLVDGLVSVSSGGQFPFGTLAVNLSGALLLGLLLGIVLRGDAYLLAGTAVLGSYTTFSTWIFESHRLVEDDQRWFLTANTVLSLVLGVGAVAAGRIIGSA
jgi:fluoride exporter